MRTPFAAIAFCATVLAAPTSALAQAADAHCFDPVTGRAVHGRALPVVRQMGASDHSAEGDDWAIVPFDENLFDGERYVRRADRALRRQVRKAGRLPYVNEVSATVSRRYRHARRASEGYLDRGGRAGRDWLLRLGPRRLGQLNGVPFEPERGWEGPNLPLLDSGAPTFFEGPLPAPTRGVASHGKIQRITSEQRERARYREEGAFKPCNPYLIYLGRP